MKTQQPTEWGETVRERMRVKAQAGIPTGPVPLGYKKVHKDGVVRVVIDEATAPLVQEAFRLALLKRNSLSKILTVITAQGLVSQHGTPLHPTGLWRILTNPFYTGSFVYDKQLIDGSHPPLICKTKFVKVKANLEKRCRFVKK